MRSSSHMHGHAGRTNEITLSGANAGRGDQTARAEAGDAAMLAADGLMADLAKRSIAALQACATGEERGNWRE
ncbi:hypothetical protein ACQR1I_19170 [Bradyrhizobium sp. HKCCYLS2038]|uniref:hypothetical protein n=1 Tax=unclassified Bradyrhizobium TaxID=2631580 RepID=UPI003EB6E390